MATNGFTTIGISNVSDELLNQLHDIEGGQKRELVSNLLTGLLISEPAIIISILNAGKSAMSGFNSGVEPVLGAGITFPEGHFMAGFSATYEVEKLVVGVEAYRAKVAQALAEVKAAQEASASTEQEEPKKGKK